MAKFSDKLDGIHRDFIANQKMFFTSTAPVSGRINLSPKGMDSFRIIDDNTVAYLDVTGSGNETAAHLLENGRITVMFCSFDEKPLILRLYGHGESIPTHHATWKDYVDLFTLLPGTRQIILIHVDSVQTSCGYAVPRYDYTGERDTLERWAEKKGEAGIRDYWKEKNQTSIDGLKTGLIED
ncbi:MAG: pyridoxamine 5'-phosphate oxidase family protein [Gammaproteobacteria bacterium]|nr:pyridoxamine 5'-phosphate oxidase family protein [Gammaproteobacteria bacterium]MDH5801859.1 pyridoxamine 5'-phosphate oxidase family protein [Gammaproteobacteria bacterium]